MVSIRTLMDNTAGSTGTVAEHGLSFWIEREGHAVLFDTGKTGAFLDNARILGIDPGRAAALVLSHGHYDHGGGVRALYERTAFRGAFWSGGGVFDWKWALDAAGPRCTGLDFDAAYLDGLGIEWRTVAAPDGKTIGVQVVPGIYVVNGFPRVHSCEAANPRFAVDRGGSRILDDFADEVCLAIRLDDGIALVSGCAHPGLLNMIDAVSACFDLPVRAVFGGSHLVEADGARIDETIACLSARTVSLCALGHCTGDAGTTALLARLPAYRPLSTGAAFELKCNVVDIFVK